jgi:hypothetical protein
VISSKFSIVVVFIAIIGILSGCATLSKEECLAADWMVIGDADGAAGYAPQERFAGHTKACAKIGVVPDQTLWNQGYQKGVIRYCTPQNGLSVGEAGKSYANVCPLNSSASFQQAYDLGKKAYDIRRSIDSRKSSISSRQTQISEKFKTIASLTPAQQVAAQYELAELNRLNSDDQAEISRLTGELALANRDIQDFRLQISRYNNGL